MADSLIMPHAASLILPGTETGPSALDVPGMGDVQAKGDVQANGRAALANDGMPLRSQQVSRGICRLFARNDVWLLAEMPLRGGRRADLMGLDGKGRVVIVEIKTARSDLLGDGKWPDYLEHCDRFYWGLPPELDRGVLDTAEFRPDMCGVIVADEYDGEIVRPAPSHPLAAARRKVEVERLARTALRRGLVAADPHCAGWGG